MPIYAEPGKLMLLVPLGAFSLRPTSNASLEMQLPTCVLVDIGLADKIPFLSLLASISGSMTTGKEPFLLDIG